VFNRKNTNSLFFFQNFRLPVIILVLMISLFFTHAAMAGVCGDGVRDVGEVCDNGASNSDSVPNACRTD